MNKTQCPHCFTVYVISDEQLRVSQGMVRCGTCKERFQAQLIGQQKVASFDPRNVFIEPISEQDDATNEQVADLKKETEQVDFKLDGLDDNPNSEGSIRVEDHTAEDTTQSKEGDPVKSNHKVSDKKIVPKEKQESAWEFSIDPDASPEDDFKAIEESIETSTADTGDDNEQDITPGIEAAFDSVKIEAPIEESERTISTDSHQSAIVPVEQTEDHDDDNDGSLIDEVNQLIAQKILQPGDETTSNSALVNDTSSQAADQIKTPTPTRESAKTSEPTFTLDKNARTPLSTWFFSFVLLLIAFGLVGSLTYQLWFKQAIDWPDDKRLQTKIAPLLAPIKEPIEQSLARLNIEVPERRNLSRLELVSARTKPHPTRSSTILLRVTLINGASINQPLPWLELSLHDSEGRLVSRRGLSPEDYSHNNRIQVQIGPRELRKVTIELLKFPKQVTGYELKLLNK